MSDSTNPSQNAHKHGCRSRSVIVRGENQADLDLLWETFLSRYAPTNPAEFEFLRLAVDASWRMQRSERVLNLFELTLFEENPDPASWTDDQLRRLALFQRYKTADTNAFHKALRLLEHVEKTNALNDLAIDRRAAQIANETQKDETFQKAKTAIRDHLATPPTLPSPRTDGGCTCIPCSLEWATRELEKTPVNPEPGN